MERKPTSPATDLYQLALWGAGSWLVLLLFPLGEGVLATIHKLLLLVILFFCPLLLSLIRLPEHRTTEGYSRLALFHYLTSFAVATSLVISHGVPSVGAAFLPSGWLLFTLWLAWHGLRRLLPWRWPRPEELAISAGLLYLPVGAAWLVLSRAGINPLGFSDAIVLLTAIHFHYAAFAIPIIVGMTGRQLGRLKVPAWTAPLYRVLVAGVIAGPPLIAVGITLSRPLEMVAASLFALTLMAFALLTLGAIVPLVVERKAQLFLALSSLILLGTMLLAMGYAVGGVTGLITLTIPQMVQLHGWGNALVVFFALLAWLSIRPGPILAAQVRLTPEEITIRPFTPQDQRAVRSLILEGLAERFGHMNRSINQDLADIEATYLRPGHCLLVAEHAGEIIGSGALLLHEPTLGQMVRLSVRRDYRGQGLGSTLIHRLIDEARQRGLTRLIVETNDDWYDALALYQRHGFVPYKEAEGNIYMEMDI